MMQALIVAATLTTLLVSASADAQQWAMLQATRAAPTADCLEYAPGQCFTYDSNPTHVILVHP